MRAIPKGFKFKYIKFKGYNSVKYNIAAIYENEKVALIPYTERQYGHQFSHY